MSQLVNRRNKQKINAPFRAKSAGVSLIIVLLIGAYYFANVLDLLPADEAIPEGAAGLAITAIIMIVILEATLQIVLFMGAGRIENRTEKDDTITAKASRNAYTILTVGTFATFASMFANFTPFEMSNILIFAFILAESVKFASQLVYYQRSA